MNFDRRFVSSFLIAIIAIGSLITEWYYLLSFALVFVLVIVLIDKMGKGIVLRETIALFYVVTCLLMPIIGYTVYTESNKLALMFVKFMPVDEASYFGYVLPALSFFCLALTWPLGAKQALDEGHGISRVIFRIRNEARYSTGLVLLVSGIIISLILPIIPAGLRFFSTLIYFSSFAGVLYIFYAKTKANKSAILVLFFLFILFRGISTGLFTLVAYMSITIFSFFLIGSKAGLLKKLVLFLGAVLLVVVIQNVKGSYRKEIWSKRFEGNRAEVFVEIFADKIGKGELLFEKESFFPVYIRANQGFNVSLVMKRFPAVIPHDNGTALYRSILASLVPRFLWPDKPESGGRFNMWYYAGKRIRGWSTNVGPVGEAYGAFGRNGGIMFMSLLGIFIRWVYKKIFAISKNLPLILCWLPVLFYEITYSAETDTLQVLNSFFKGAFFIWILYKLMPDIFNIRRRNKAINWKMPYSKYEVHPDISKA